MYDLDLTQTRIIMIPPIDMNDQIAKIYSLTSSHPQLALNYIQQDKLQKLSFDSRYNLRVNNYGH